MSSARQANKLAKNISCIEIAQRKQAERKSTSSQGVAERAYERATAWQRGEGVHVTRSTSKQLEQIPNLRPVLSLVESSTDFLEALQDTNVRHFLRRRELLKQGEAPIFLHEDHPKLLYIVAMKFRAVKATYQSYRASDMQNDSVCVIVYFSGADVPGDTVKFNWFLSRFLP
jgi:hypothetical protein